MNYRVIKFFIDHDSVKAYIAGELFPCDDPERAAQLIHRGYIIRGAEEASEVKEDPADDKPEPKKKTTAKGKTAAKKVVSKKKA